MKIAYQFEIVIDRKLYPQHELIPQVPWEKIRIGHRILFPGDGFMNAGFVTELHSAFADDRSEVLTRIVADSNF